MGISEDEEILQDFLVEAGEILELLGEQLVDLENTPQDYDLLNSIFRGFHTIKGGAGFLNLTSLVEVCHRAEDVFNVLRQGDLLADAHLMDVILKVHDALTEMFEFVQRREDPPAAEAALLQALERLTDPTAQPPVAVPETPVAASIPAEPVSETPVAESAPADPVPETAVSETAPTDSVPADSKGGDEISEEEFEALLDQMNSDSAPAPAANTGSTTPSSDDDSSQSGASSSSNEITDDEFESLLNQLHGEGVPTTAVESDSVAPDVDTSVASEASAPSPAPANNEVAPPPAAAPEITEPVTPAETAKPVADKAKVAPVPAKKEVVHQGEATVRVDTKRLDDIMNLVGELVLVRNRLATIGMSNPDENMSAAVSSLDLVTTDLQSSVMKTRMQPIKKVFGRFPRVVRDLARSLNKNITLEMIGEDTDLDKNLVEALADPLVHLVRNSVDHGIEMPDVREQAGKPREGKITLQAEQEGDHILLMITDDGAGMDANKLRQIAVDKGLMDADVAARLSDHDCFHLIFMPGFSTKEEISDISGRGVGMDVVKTRITQLNGMLDIDSELGKGSTIVIKVPLTLAIMPTLMIRLEEQVFALPLASVVEIFHLDLTDVNVVDGQPVILIRNKALPIYYLRNWLIKNVEQDAKQGMGHVVVVNVGSKQVGFIVDQLIGQEEVVIKPLGALLQGTVGLAGATITGDGLISIILDVPGLMKAYANNY